VSCVHRAENLEQLVAQFVRIGTGVQRKPLAMQWRRLSFLAHDVSTKRHDVGRKGNVNEAQCNENEEANPLHPVVVALRDAHGRVGDDFGPTQRSMDNKHKGGEDVVISPEEICFFRGHLPKSGQTQAGRYHEP